MQGRIDTQPVNVAAEVAAQLVQNGLKDSRVLHGQVGLRWFSTHGLTEANQDAVIHHVERLLGAGA